MALNRQTTSYYELKEYLKTGDIMLMHGLYPSSTIVQTLEGSLWSHSAIIVIAEDIGINIGSDNILLWESNLDTPVNDIILNKSKSGPMLVRLSERLKNNISNKDDSMFAIRYLNYDRTRDMYDKLKLTIKEVHSATFPNSQHELQDSMEGRFLNKQTPLDTMFCSELVAYTYIKWGLLSSNHPYNGYCPVDFSEKLSVGLLKRAQLSQEIMLEVDLNKL